MTEINNLFKQGDIEFSNILCPRCRKNEFVLFQQLRILQSYTPSAEFHCSACREQFQSTVSLNIVEKRITKEILVISPNTDEDI